jgi:hypothetical protein
MERTRYPIGKRNGYSEINLNNIQNDFKNQYFTICGFCSFYDETAPVNFKKLYNPDSLNLSKNIRADMESLAGNELIGYYGHCSALDYCIDELLSTTRLSGI